MKKALLQRLLDAEVEAWAGKSFTKLVEALPDVVAYERGNDADGHQFEVQLLEHEPDHVHVCVSIDDGSFLRSFAPLTHSFIVYSDGRVDK